MKTPTSVLAPSGALELARAIRKDDALPRDLRNWYAEKIEALASLAQQGEAVATFTVTDCGPCLPDLDMEWLTDYRTFAGKGPQLLFTHPAAMEEACRMIAELRDYVVNERDAQVLPRKAASYQRELDSIDAFLAANGG